MPELFKLIKKKFSKIHGEWQWTYSCLFTFTFQKRTIKKITITDHPWRKKGREKITKELILNICRQELNGRKNIKPSRRVDNRNVYVREWIPYGERDYLLVFWFEDYNPDWIWIRNCYPWVRLPFYRLLLPVLNWFRQKIKDLWHISHNQSKKYLLEKHGCVLAKNPRWWRLLSRWSLWIWRSS